MNFPLKNFWRIIPYTLYALIIYNSGLHFVLLLALALIVSLFKSETINQLNPINQLNSINQLNRNPYKLNLIFRYLFFFVESALLLFVGRAYPNWLAAWLIVPVIDWGWCFPASSGAAGLSAPIKSTPILNTPLLRKIHLGILFALMLVVMGVSKNLWISAFIFASAFWVGVSLNEMEQRKVKAQEYYDRLRISEEALRKANDELSAYYETLEEVTILRERTRISREIHDNVGHALSTTLIQLQSIQLRLEKEAPTQVVFIEKLISFIANALENTREIVHHMGRDALKKQHLKHELAELCHNFSDLTQIMVTLTCSDNELNLDSDYKLVLFRVVQEGLTNAVKHGHATQIKVILTASRDRILLTIQDNGCGTNSIVEGFGQQTMRARIQKLGGELHFLSEHNNGFTVKASLPGVTL